MSIPNHSRALVALVREIAAEGDYNLRAFSQDWILRLEKDGSVRHIFGYNFEINSATARLVAADKAATANLLAHKEISHVEHRLFLHPRLANYVSAKGNWDLMQAYAKEHGYPLVVKPNEGTGGEDIFRVGTALELEEAVGELFGHYRSICLSPFLDIEQEYRVVILDRIPLLTYAKQRPQVVGDGKSSILDLIERLLVEGQLDQRQASSILETHPGDLGQVLKKGQELVVGWKHNLGEGAIPQILEDGKEVQELSAIAQRASEAIGIRFASVDVVKVAGKLSILEINAGVMMEYFVRHYPEARERVKALYAEAIKRMFAGV